MVSTLQVTVGGAWLKGRGRGQDSLGGPWLWLSGKSGKAELYRLAVGTSVSQLPHPPALQQLWGARGHEEGTGSVNCGEGDAGPAWETEEVRAWLSICRKQLILVSSASVTGQDQALKPSAQRSPRETDPEWGLQPEPTRLVTSREHPLEPGAHVRRAGAADPTLARRAWDAWRQAQSISRGSPPGPERGRGGLPGGLGRQVARPSPAPSARPPSSLRTGLRVPGPAAAASARAAAAAAMEAGGGAGAGAAGWSCPGPGQSRLSHSSPRPFI